MNPIELKVKIAVLEDELRIALKGVLLAKSWLQNAQWNKRSSASSFQRMLDSAIDYYKEIESKLEKAKGEKYE